MRAAPPRVGTGQCWSLQHPGQEPDSGGGLINLELITDWWVPHQLERTTD